jgi:hypothetical protein
MPARVRANASTAMALGSDERTRGSLGAAGKLTQQMERFSASSV